MGNKLGFNKAILRRETTTPTFAFTTGGIAALIVHHALRKKIGLDVVAFVLLTLAGVGGCAMAIAGEVRNKGHVWGWAGIVKSLRSPSRTFRVAFGAHVTQALLAGAIAASWRFGGKRKDDGR